MNDAINSPSHYRGADGTEAIDVIEMQFGIAGHLPQAVAYILRHQRKGTAIDDLRKAQWYVRRAINHVDLIDVPTMPFTLPDLPSETRHEIVVAFGLTTWAADALIHIFEAATSRSVGLFQSYLGVADAYIQRAINDLAARAPPPPPAPPGLRYVRCDGSPMPAGWKPPHLPREAPEMAASLSPIATS